MRAHSIEPLAGLEKTASSVLRCLLFIRQTIAIIAIISNHYLIALYGASQRVGCAKPRRLASMKSANSITGARSIARIRATASARGTR